MQNGRWLKSASLIALSLFAAAPDIQGQETLFAPTIPVLDMQDYYKPETREQFYSEVSKALHEVGFFAVVNPGLNMEALEKGYAAIQEFFQAPQALKKEIMKPELSGQRGYVSSETAQGHGKVDFKEFLHIGRANNFWPSWMDLQEPTENLLKELDFFSLVIGKALASSMAMPENFINDMTKEGECLLRPIHYPPNPEPGQFWAAAHTDIDLLTILPMATEEGLQVFYNGEWIDVRVPANAFVVNAGDMLQNMSNGYFRSGLHRVVSRPDYERYSIVYFVHPRDNDDMSPLPSCVEATTGYPQFPKATRWELLAVRLRELKLISPKWLELLDQCGINERIETLAFNGLAHPAVQLTYEVWLKWLADQQE